jgi:hypothetical protein
MNPKSSALALAMTAVVGCTPTRSEVRRDAVLSQLGLGNGTKGQVIAPKRCNLRLAVLSRPLHDEVLNDVLWRVADEQTLAPEVRRTLEANGLRMGMIVGSLPREVEDLLNASAPHKVDPTQLLVSSGENTLFSMNTAASKVSLLLNHDDRVVGKDYADASGYLRLTATQDGPTGVTLRFVPELHHGPIQHRFAADAATNPFSVQQFVMKDGQQEDTIRELAATLTLQPGQIAVVGCRPERERSLGHFLLTEPESNSDRLLQKVLLVWASQGRGDGLALAPAPTATPARPDPTPAPSSAETGKLGLRTK